MRPEPLPPGRGDGARHGAANRRSAPRTALVEARLAVWQEPRRGAAAAAPERVPEPRNAPRAAEPRRAARAGRRQVVRSGRQRPAGSQPRPARGAGAGSRHRRRAFRVPARAASRSGQPPSARPCFGRGRPGGVAVRRGGAGSCAGPTGSGARVGRSGAGTPRQGRMHRDPVRIRPSGRACRSGDDTPAGQPPTTERSRGASLRTIGPSGPHTTMSSIRAP